MRQVDSLQHEMVQAEGRVKTGVAHRGAFCVEKDRVACADQDVLGADIAVDEDVLRRFRVDFRRVDLGGPDNCQDEPVGQDGYRDEWSVVRTRPKGGFYYDLTGSPFAEEDTMSAIERHPWPDPDNPGR